MSGVRSNESVGGEAEYFTMIDESARKVTVLNTVDVLNKLLSITEGNDKINLNKTNGFLMTGWPENDIVYTNEYVGTKANWKAAKVRSSMFLINANKIKLSMHIMKKGWKNLEVI